MSLRSWLKQLFRGEEQLEDAKRLPEPLPEPTDEVAVLRTWGNRIKYECGHTDVSAFTLSTYGVVSEDLMQRRFCTTCMVRKVRMETARCALCGLPIFPGYGVALYKVSSDLPYQHVAAFADDETVLGCLRMECAGAVYTVGHWTGKEFQPGFGSKSPVVHASFRTDEPTTAEDTHAG